MRYFLKQQHESAADDCSEFHKKARDTTLLGFGRLSDFLSAQFLPISCIVSALLVVLVVLFFSGLARHRRMSVERRGEDVDSFVLYLASYGFDPEIARATYDYLVSEEDVTFPIRHSDRFDQDLRISDDEVHRAVEHLVVASGREERSGMRATSLATVEDLLRYVQACPMKERKGIHCVSSTPNRHRAVDTTRRVIVS